jgi:hypothetical protein
MDGDYLTDNSLCHMCSESCHTCVGPRSIDCTSCESDSVLEELYEIADISVGRCACADGYY